MKEGVPGREGPSSSGPSVLGVHRAFSQGHRPLCASAPAAALPNYRFSSECRSCGEQLELTLCGSLDRPVLHSRAGGSSHFYGSSEQHLGMMGEAGVRVPSRC